MNKTYTVAQEDPGSGDRGAQRITRRKGIAAVFAAGTVLLAGMIGSSPALAAVQAPEANSSVDAAPKLPPFGAGLDYQIGTPYDPPKGVEIVVRDVSAKPADGTYSICRINAFLEDPGDARWKANPDLVLADRAYVDDQAEPDRLLLDTSGPEKRQRIAHLMRPQIEQCAKAGYQAVEFDYLNSANAFWGDPVDPYDNKDMLARYSRIAHSLGLAVAQKNMPELAPEIASEGIADFAITDECGITGQCGEYHRAYEGRVIGVEYVFGLDAGSGSFTPGSWPRACAEPDRPASYVLRDRQNQAPGGEYYYYEACP